ncbi:hypothetical protein ACFYO1_26520 [Nocardia sp. NPDC006044]|uniref:hypothetical protein n=1 Tax=Nocardia sp. NPDC006044 TaxID=3364306 RepID=UPI0036BD536A
MRPLACAATVAVTAVGAIGIGSTGAAAAAPVQTDALPSGLEIMLGTHAGDSPNPRIAMQTGMATFVGQSDRLRAPDAADDSTTGDAAFDMRLGDIRLDPHTERFNTAIGAAATEFGLATGIGTLVGGIAGASIGCGVGGVAGAIFGAPILDAGGLTIIAGCLAGAGALISVGSLLGAALLGVPVGIAAAIQFQNTMNEPYDS